MYTLYDILEKRLANLNFLMELSKPIESSSISQENCREINETSTNTPISQEMPQRKFKVIIMYYFKYNLNTVKSHFGGSAKV